MDKDELFSVKLEAVFIDILNKITEDVIDEETAAEEAEEFDHPCPSPPQTMIVVQTMQTIISLRKTVADLR